MNFIKDFEPPKLFLQQTDERDPLTLFQSYANYLRTNAACFELPVPLERIRLHHKLQIKKASLPQRGFLLGDTIFINSDDRETVQSFTQAHEMMETLVIALQAEMPSRFPEFAWDKPDRRKEQWCEAGAAEILMPSSLFFPLVNQQGVSFQTARQLASLCQTSLIATTRRLIEASARDCVFILFKEGHKKGEIVPSKNGQQVLWGSATDFDPPAELRVWRRWKSSNSPFICDNESVSRQTAIYQTLQEGIVGQVYRGYDDLGLENIKGPKRTESMLVTIDNSQVVMALIHL